MNSYYRWRAHPWHGLEVGPNPPQLVHAYVEITPFDVVKYEVDKVTGYLIVDRPQRTSSVPPPYMVLSPGPIVGSGSTPWSPKQPGPMAIHWISLLSASDPSPTRKSS
jgi:inorganic pyrophosphatase